MSWPLVVAAVSIDAIPDGVWDLARQGGAFGVAIAWVLLERRRNNESQARNDKLVDDLKKVAQDSALAMQRIYDLLSSGGKK